MSPLKTGIVIVGFVLAGLLMIYADTRMSHIFSQFWHSHHADLRTALKEARRIARDSAPEKATKVTNDRHRRLVQSALTPEDAAHESPKNLPTF
jgi:23S rRNA C2498 (ribose-2'-O)-methylase RlmM